MNIKKILYGIFIAVFSFMVFTLVYDELGHYLSATFLGFDSYIKVFIYNHCLSARTHCEGLVSKFDTVIILLSGAFLPLLIATVLNFYFSGVDFWYRFCFYVPVFVREIYSFVPRFISGNLYNHGMHLNKTFNNEYVCYIPLVFCFVWFMLILYSDLRKWSLGLVRKTTFR